MASSDDEGEMVPKNVSDYEFISGDDKPISFASLPVQWNKDEKHERKLEQTFLSGKTDNGLRKIYKQVIAWKFDLSFDKPRISVLSLEGYWIELLKPRKPFEDIVRTILVTVHILHFVKWNPQRSQEALWGQLDKTFSFERRPSEDDLGDHFPLINEALMRDESLANSKLLSTFLEEKPGRRKMLNEVEKPPFIVDEVDEIENVDDEDDEDDCFDAVCAICDNGGHLYLCDGKCMRSFHATVEDGDESHCESLGLTRKELDVIKDVPFYCKNCEYKQHQCFACGKLGSSDESSGPEVFCCVNGTCGFFYHPYCVAKLLHPEDDAAAKEHQQKIASGEKFACPAHRCHACKELESRKIKELQFAVCRRCPRAYHRKCLPREIAVDTDDDLELETIQRAWEDLIPNRILIYCLDHEIDPDILTPVRNHIKFPGPQREKNNNKKKQLKEGGYSCEDTVGKITSAKPLKGIDKVSSGLKQGDLFRRRVEKLPAGRSVKMQKVINRNASGKSKEATTEEREMSLGNKLYAAFYNSDSGSEKSGEGGNVHGELEKTQKIKPMARRISRPSLTLDGDTKKRIFKLMIDASSSLTLDQVKERHKPPSTHTQYSKSYVDNISLGKVDGAIQSLRAALKKLEGGGSIQDAKMVCGNDLLVQMLRWKDRMKVYLAPFLYGMRYTSFGRHFTKLDKLKEIVDMLHLYIQDGDTLVDFCCGSNDFSCLMKKKVDEIGKNCSFKNYDILQAKNDFNFERRDWMHVRPDELPDGSQLIMGLNPPFGVNASLANKFINKALEFKPKLIVLIVPRETERLDVKNSRYDLIWEDDQMFAGKSFYLPGSVDVNDKQIEDWNVNAPVFYLWSNPTWTSKHKAIAEQHGHSSRGQKKTTLETLEPVIPEPEKTQTHRQDSSVENRAPDVNKVNTSVISNNLDGKRKKKRKNRSNIFPLEDESVKKRPTSRHLSPNIASPPERLETCSQAHSARHPESDNMNFPTYHHHQQQQPPYAEAPAAATYNNRNESLDDVVRRYCLESEGPLHPGISGGRQVAYVRSPIPSPIPSPRLISNYGLRAPTAENIFPYDRSMNDEPNSWSQRSVYPPSYTRPGFPSSLGHSTASPGYGEMGTSTMHRYAARLDSMDHGQMRTTPPVIDRSGGIYRLGGPRPPASSHASSLGFAPGPYRPYSQHNSSGWLNE